MGRQALGPSMKEKRMIRIKAKRNNFRRAGIAHPDQWTEYPDDAFTPEQIAALKAETMLIVQIAAPEPTEPTPDPVDEESAKPRKGRKG
jgi:hypothetical protein